MAKNIYNERYRSLMCSARSKPVQHEEIMCINFIKQIAIDPSLRKYKPYIFHIPMGGKRDAVTGAKLKAMGTQAGVADYMVIHHVIRYFSNPVPKILWLEFKYGTGKQSESQKEFEKLVKECAHKYVVVYSIDAAIAEIKNFFGDNNKGKE